MSPVASQRFQGYAYFLATSNGSRDISGKPPDLKKEKEEKKRRKEESGIHSKLLKKNLNVFLLFDWTFY